MLQYPWVSPHEHLGWQKEVERGMKLKEARISTGLGRRKASKCLGMGIAQLYRYEAGLLRPGIEAVMRISQALDLNPWGVNEFQHALRKAEALGLIAPANNNGHRGEQE